MIIIFSRFFKMVNSKIFKIRNIKSIVTSAAICVNNDIRLGFADDSGISVLLFYNKPIWL